MWRDIFTPFSSKVVGHLQSEVNGWFPGSIDDVGQILNITQGEGEFVVNLLSPRVLKDDVFLEINLWFPGDVVGKLVSSCEPKRNRLSLDTLVGSLGGIELKFVGVGMLVVMVPVMASCNIGVLLEISLHEEVSLLVFVGCLHVKICHFFSIVLKGIPNMNVIIGLHIQSLWDNLPSIIGPFEGHIEPDLERTQLGRAVMKRRPPFVEVVMRLVSAWMLHLQWCICIVQLLGFGLNVEAELFVRETNGPFVDVFCHLQLHDVVVAVLSNRLQHIWSFNCLIDNLLINSVGVPEILINGWLGIQRFRLQLHGRDWSWFWTRRGGPRWSA